jgi:hypothetical protein
MSRIFTPKANQGPLLGIFITGPAGAIVGFIAGALFSQRHWCSNANHLTKRYSQPLADWCWSAFNTDQHQPISYDIYNLYLCCRVEIGCKMQSISC